MERRLIDANAIHGECNSDNPEFIAGWNALAVEIDQAPTIDAVEVVRKPVAGYEGYYEVDQFGRVYGVERVIRVKDGGREYAKPVAAKKLKQHMHSQGYKVVVLTKNGESKKAFVHRLVADAFVENPNGYPVVNHIDEDKTNNFADNLEWCTVRYNTTYGKGQAKRVKKLKGVPHTQEHKDKIADSVREYYKNNVSKCKGMDSTKRKRVVQIHPQTGEAIAVHASVELAAGSTEKRRNITAVCNGKRKTAYGYKWRWADEERRKLDEE